MLLTQVMPVPLHAPPLQHDWPRLPHPLEPCWHVPLLQLSPLLQQLLDEQSSPTLLPQLPLPPPFRQGKKRQRNPPPLLLLVAGQLGVSPGWVQQHGDPLDAH